MPRLKKAKSARRPAAAKAEAAPKSVNEYSARVPEAARPMFDKLRATLRSVIPAEATEVISYGIPAFARDGVIVWFAAFASHCSLFPTAAVLEDFKDELEDFSTSKGTIHFPLDKPLPSALIKKMVKARVTQKKALKRG